MIGNIIGWCLFGLVAGALARLLTPGRDPIGCLGTIVVGVAGAFVGGLITYLVWGNQGDQIQPAGMVGAVIGGIVVLLLQRQLRRPRR